MKRITSSTPSQCFKFFVVAVFSLSVSTIDKLSAQEVPVLEWARSIGSAGTDRGTGIATDAVGNVYTVGEFTGTVDFDPGPGVFNLTGLGSFDIYISKSDANGNFLWAKAVTGPGTDSPSTTLVVDASGNIYVTGIFSNTVDFDPGTGVLNLTSAGEYEIFVLKLDTDGNLIWAKAMGGADRDSGRSIAVDASGNVYTTGTHWWTADFDPGPGVFNITPTGGYGIFVSKLDSNGSFVWAKSIFGPGSLNGDSGNSIKVDASGNLYVTGTFSGTKDFNPGAGVFNLTSTTGDLFILKLDQDGDFLWVKSFGDPFGATGISLVLDASANIYMSGRIGSIVDFDSGPGVYNVDPGVVVAKFDTDGNLIWAKSTKSTTYKYAIGLAIDASQNVYSAGVFVGTADFDPDPIGNFSATADDYDLYILKLDVDGNFVWATTAGGSSWDQAQAVTIDASGYLYTTGYFQTTTDFDPGPCTYNLTSAGMADSFVRKLSLGMAGAAPTITSFTPTSGAVGTTVTITGTNFSTTPANNTVLFNLTPAAVTASTNTSITTTVPGGATTGKISVTVNCLSAISATDFTVGASLLPTITSFTPVSGPVGTSVILTGTNFSTTPANNALAFNGTAAVVTASTATSITTSVPVGATTGKITVTVAGNTATSAADFTVTTATNQPPIISSSTTAAPINGIVVVELLSLLSDPNDNLDLSTLSLLSSTSEQGAAASINPSSELELDYGGVLFAGVDRVTIEVCDLLSACSQQELAIEVSGNVIVYNALSPNADGENDNFNLKYIELFSDTEKNHVTIYNRWGDVVFEVSDYDNDNNVFTGLNTNGKELPSGTYFYKIEFSSGRTMKTGFLSLKR
jgi:gliding motility-associated-like protein